MSQAFVNERSAGRALTFANWLAALPALPFYCATAVVVLLTGWVQYAPLAGDEIRAYAFSFACLSFALQACAWCCLPYIRATRGSLRIRWLLFNGAVVMAAMCYAIAALQHFQFIPHGVAQICLIVTSNLSEMLCLLAATVFFSDSTPAMMLLDWVQALLFATLRFGLTYAPHGYDQFSVHHLEVKQLVAIALTGIAWIASAGSVSRNERRFLHLLTGFLAVRSLSFFFSNQVSYLWLHYRYASAWDIPATLLYLLYAAFMMRVWKRPSVSPALRPSLLVRNLMPSLLALSSLTLAFCTLTVWLPGGIMAVLLTMVCYILRTVLLQEQITHQHKALLSRNEQLEALAELDALTGVGNRRSLASAYERLTLKPAQRLALLLVDTDHFKQVNDRFGHLYGDQVLMAISGVLRTACKPFAGSHCARFGGDEFALCLPDVTQEQALKTAEAIRHSIEALNFKGGELPISASLGGVLTPAGDRPSLEELLDQADVALYRAKRRGRNCVVWEGTSEVPKPKAEERLEPAMLAEKEQELKAPTCRSCP